MSNFLGTGTVDIDFVIHWTKVNICKVEKVMYQLGLVSKLPISGVDLFDFKKEFIKKRNLTRISHRISRQVRQDFAPDLFSMIREHCQKIKTSIIEDKDGVTDCLNCQRGCEKCGLIAWNFYDPSNPVNQIDLIITFDLKGKSSKNISTSEGIIRVLSKNELIKMKKKSGRPQDLEDIKALEVLI